MEDIFEVRFGNGNILTAGTYSDVQIALQTCLMTHQPCEAWKITEDSETMIGKVGVKNGELYYNLVK